jgi:hypothetical protein
VAPTRIVRSPAIAVAVLPDTGASTNRTPCSPRRAPICPAAVGPMVLMSIAMPPGRSASTTASS